MIICRCDALVLIRAPRVEYAPMITWVRVPADFHLKEGPMQSRANFYKLSGAVVVILLVIAGSLGQAAHAGPLQATPNTGPVTSPSGRFYVVQVGDTLFNIAARYNVSISQLATINRIYDVNNVYVGEVLALPNPLPAGAVQNLPGTVQQVPTAIPVTTISSGSTTIYTPPVVTYPVGTTITTVTSYTSYVVQPGDFLSSIAARFNTTPAAILSANAISDPNLLYVGQLLTIPRVTTTSVVQPARQVVVPAASGRVYIVQPGDNLFSIGARTGRNAYAIAQANGLLDLNAIYVGEPLVLP